MEPQERVMFQGAIMGLCSVIGVLFGFVIKDHRECKRDRLELRKLFEKALKDWHFMKGQMAVYKSIFRRLKIKLPETVGGEGEEEAE